jgi:hypothetical protein
VRQVDGTMLNEVQFVAEDAVRRAIEAGVITGSGSGGGGSGDSGGGGGSGGGLGGGAAALAQTGVGTDRAHTIEEFEANILAQYNVQRQLRGMSPVDRLDDAQKSIAEAEFNRAENERKRALKRDEDEKVAVATRKEKADETAKSLGGLAWTAEGGFQKGGAETASDKPDAEPKDSSDKIVPPSVLDSGKAGGGKAKKELPPAAWAVDLLDPSPPATSFNVRSKEEFESATLTQYNINRQLRGEDPVSGFTQGQRAQVWAQFEAAQGVELRTKREAAEKKDADRRDREAKARDEAATNVATSAALLSQDDDDDEGEVTTPRTRSAASRSTATASAVAAHDDYSENGHLDELTDRIYDRLRRKLRTELIVDRERAGLLTDFR